MSIDKAIVIERVVGTRARTPTAGVRRVVARDIANESTIVGRGACWMKRTKKGDASVFVSSLEVKESHRRRGIGRAIVEEIESIGREDFGATKCSLTVIKWNANARAMYARLGFEYDDDDREIWEYVVDPLTLVQRRMSREISIG